MQEKASQADRSTTQDPARGASVLGRQLLAGFLAGASEVLGILLFVAVLLFVGTLGPLLYNISSGLRGQIPFWPAVSGLFTRSLGSLPGFIWSARWAIVGLGMLGLVLALVASQAPRLDRPWRGALSMVAALGIVGAIIFALQYANREILLTWLAGQPYLLSMQNDFLLSDTASLLIALLAALLAAYIIWGLWHWWFARWSRWLRVEPQQQAVAEPAAPALGWQAEQARLHRSKRGLPDAEPAPAPAVSEPSMSRRPLWILLAVLLGTTLALFGAVQLYNQSGSRLSGGDLFVSAQSPADSKTLDFDRAPRQLIISSINGQGVVDVTLGAEQQSAALRGAEGISLTEFGTNAPPTTVDLVGLEAGRYWLKIALREGGGGQVRYAALQGGGSLAQVASWLIGLAAGIWLALAALAILEVLTERGWFKLRSS